MLIVPFTSHVPHGEGPSSHNQNWLYRTTHLRMEVNLTAQSTTGVPVRVDSSVVAWASRHDHLRRVRPRELTFADNEFPSVRPQRAQSFHSRRECLLVDGESDSVAVFRVHDCLLELYVSALAFLEAGRAGSGVLPRRFTWGIHRWSYCKLWKWDGSGGPGAEGLMARGRYVGNREKLDCEITQEPLERHWITRISAAPTHNEHLLHETAIYSNPHQWSSSVISRRSEKSTGICRMCRVLLVNDIKEELPITSSWSMEVTGMIGRPSLM